MHGTAKKILEAVRRNWEMKLSDALSMADRGIAGHVRQYPLALLIEEGYIGVTLTHSPPEGAEAMREYSQATFLHMLTLPETDGVVEYMGIQATGSINPDAAHVFIKAKGSLYLDEAASKRADRLYSLAIAVLAGIVVAVVSSWLHGNV